MVRRLSLLLLLCSLSPYCKADADPAFIHLELDNRQIYLDGSVMLHLTATGLQAPINYEALDALPFIRRETIGNYLRMYEGKVTEFATRRIELIPEQAGTFNIGPLSAGAIQSNQLQLQVLDGKPQAWDMPPEAVQLQTRVSTTRPYAQQMLVYEATLRHRYPLLSFSADVPAFDGFRVIADKVEKRIWHDDGWRTVQWRYLLFPETAGPHRIPALHVRGRTGKSRWETAGFERSGKPVEIVAAAPPAGHWWLPAEALTLSDHWSRATDELVVGQAVTRSITILAEGVSAAQLPEISPAAVDGAQLRLTGQDRGEQFSEDTLSARLKLDFELIPQKAGVLTTPAIQLRWWDTKNDRAQQTLIPPRRLVAGLPGRADLVAAYKATHTPSAAKRPAADTLPVALAATGLLLSLGYLLWAHSPAGGRLRHRRAGADERALRRALRANSADQALRLLNRAALARRLSPAGVHLRRQIAAATAAPGHADWPGWLHTARRGKLFQAAQTSHGAADKDLPPL
ncbi:hypothetical protein Q4485_03350 [Granulosicoccaceae sp. 1_MG-2023]|nr:hypothetical protein [Granulosicoccaceae sp. 1_MG-2023]